MEHPDNTVTTDSDTSVQHIIIIQYIHTTFTKTLSPSTLLNYVYFHCDCAFRVSHQS